MKRNNLDGNSDAPEKIILIRSLRRLCDLLEETTDSANAFHLVQLFDGFQNIGFIIMIPYSRQSFNNFSKF